MTTQGSSDTIRLPPLTPTVLQTCSFQNWYQLFPQHTFRSTIINLDQPVVDYLRDNSHGLHLPDEINVTSNYTSELSDSDDDLRAEQNSQLSSSSSRSLSPPPRYSFPELTRTITETISKYDGSVFPKLNWSAPQDAGFLLVSGDGPLRCRSASDVYMLLKGSDCAFHDLDVITKVSQNSSENSLPVVLVLREWFNLNPAHEFRCFVRDRNLIAISSRSSIYYDFLVPQDVQQSISERIQTFFDSVLSPQFSLSDFIFDVYLKNSTKLAGSSAVKPNLKLIDINPFASYIDPCLFSYHELDHLYSTIITTIDRNHTSFPIVRVIESEDSHQNFRASKFQSSKLPLEFLQCPHDSDVNQLSEEFKSMLGSEGSEQNKNKKP